MTGFWVSALVFGTVFQLHGLWVCAHGDGVLDVYQPETELRVETGSSVHIQCCVLGRDDGEIIWFRRGKGNEPRVIVSVLKSARETFYNGFQNSRFGIQKHGNCFNLSISATVVSDEASYFCAFAFAAGTRLSVTGDRVTTEAAASTQTWRGDTQEKAQEKAQEKTVLGLGSALGLCALVLCCLLYFLLRRRKCDRVNTSEASPGMMMQESEESLNYAALQFSKRKADAGRRTVASAEECVYSDVNRAARCNNKQMNPNAM